MRLPLLKLSDLLFGAMIPPDWSHDNPSFVWQNSCLLWCCHASSFLSLFQGLNGSPDETYIWCLTMYCKCHKNLRCLHFCSSTLVSVSIKSQDHRFRKIQDGSKLTPRRISLVLPTTDWSPTQRVVQPNWSTPVSVIFDRWRSRIVGRHILKKAPVNLSPWYRCAGVTKIRL